MKKLLLNFTVGLLTRNWIAGFGWRSYPCDPNGITYSGVALTRQGRIVTRWTDCWEDQ